jgi:hypothetical protein
MVRDDFRLTLEGIPHLGFVVQSGFRGPGNIGTRIRVLLLADTCRWLTISCTGKYARMHQLAVRPANKEPDDDDEIICGGAADRAVPRNVGSGANQRKHGAAAGLRDRPRGRGAALERRVHDRPRSKPMRRADVGLRQPSRACAVQERVLTLIDVRTRHVENSGTGLLQPSVA